MKYNVIKNNKKDWILRSEDNGHNIWYRISKRKPYIEFNCKYCNKKCLQDKYYNQTHKMKYAFCDNRCSAKYYTMINGPLTSKGKPFSKEHLANLRKSHLGQKSWCKGLTKETDKRVALIAEKKIGMKRNYSQYHVIRICPMCNNEFDDIQSSKKKFCSLKCANTSRRGKPNGRKGKKVSLAIRKKISIAHKGYVTSEETKKKLSIALKGRTAWNKGKHNIFSKEALQKISDRHRGRKVSDEFRRKMRHIALDRIQNTKGQIQPNYNRQACEFFKKLNLIFCLGGKHAENGGEYRVKDLGYFLDFYEQDLNLVIEWDERSHYKNGKLSSKDIRRQQEIEDYLKCDFLRIKDGNITPQFYNQLEQIIAFKES